jgi:hypothetical protein
MTPWLGITEQDPRAAMSNRIFTSFSNVANEYGYSPHFQVMHELYVKRPLHILFEVNVPINSKLFLCLI